MNDCPISIGLTFFILIGLPMVKKYLIPSKMGKLSYVYFYPFSGTGYYQQKRSPIGVFFMLPDSLKLKAPLRIYLLGLAKNPQDRTTAVSLDTTPKKLVWQHPHIGSPLFRVLCNVSSLDPINIKSVSSPKYFPSAVTFLIYKL